MPAPLRPDGVPGPADATVTTILDGALMEFVDVGIRRSTVGSVARRSGVAPATVYRRIGQRGALVDAVVAREVERTLARVADGLRSVEDPAERMIEGFVLTLRLIVEHPLIRRVLELEPDAVAASFTTGAGDLLHLGRSFVAAQLRDGGGAPVGDDADRIAEVLVRFAHSLVLTPSPELARDEDARAFARAALVPLVAR